MSQECCLIGRFERKRSEAALVTSNSCSYFGTPRILGVPTIPIKTLSSTNQTSSSNLSSFYTFRIYISNHLIRHLNTLKHCQLNWYCVNVVHLIARCQQYSMPFHVCRLLPHGSQWICFVNVRVQGVVSHSIRNHLSCSFRRLLLAAGLSDENRSSCAALTSSASFSSSFEMPKKPLLKKNSRQIPLILHNLQGQHNSLTGLIDDGEASNLMQRRLFHSKDVKQYLCSVARRLEVSQCTDCYKQKKT
jgi:hypothetical protein